VIIGEGKMVAGVQPAVVGMAETVEFADVDHGSDLGRFMYASSVRRVTITSGIRMPKVAKVGTTARVRARAGGCRMCRIPSASSAYRHVLHFCLYNSAA
jgi:hypothetical protein